jgi:hypothetical protein
MEYTWWNGEPRGSAGCRERTLSFENGEYRLFYHGTHHTGLDSEKPSGAALSEKQAALWLYEKDPSEAVKWFPGYSYDQLRREWLNGDFLYPPKVL